MKGLVKGQKGQALVAALILLVVGGLILTPLLGLMGTGIKSGQVFEQKVDEIYAADAGVEDAMWHIRYDDNNSTLLKDVLGAGYNEYDYSTVYPYLYHLSVNDKDVTVNITNVWIPKDISVPSPSVARQIMDDEKLLIVGYPDAAASTYDIKIVYYYQGSCTLNIKTLGIWLSSGFEYTEYSGSCSLQGQSFYSAPTISLDKGGCAVVWNFTSPYPLLSSFPPNTQCSGSPLVRIFTFKYTGPAGQIPELVASWVTTSADVPGTDYNYSWDDSIRLYKIVSQAGAIQVEAYGAKTKFRKLKSAVSGDYFGTGNSLIGGNLDSPDNYHYQLYRSTQATIATDDNDDTLGIPSDATIDAAYLYWTGWIDPTDYQSPDSGSQTRYPSGDISRSGTWDKAAGTMYSYVDEQGAHDGDFSSLLDSTTYGSNALFSFTAFDIDVPAGMAIELTVYVVARNAGSYGSDNMRPAIRVGDSNYLTTSDSVTLYPSSSYTTISYTYDTNPNNNNQPWTQDQINGIGTHALQGFGVYSTDASPSIRLTQVYATVTWGFPMKYFTSNTEEDNSILIESTARVNRVLFNNIAVTADKWQLLYPPEYDNTDREGSWFYTCKADVTDLLKGWIDDETISSNGAGTYTVGHVAEDNEEDPDYSFSFYSGGGSTGYPLGTPSPSSNPATRFTTCHAGWSLLILYHCASVYNHQFYLYDIDTTGFTFFTGRANNADFDNDGSPGGNVAGFLVPPQVPGEINAARITVFVGEGDKGYTGDYFKVKGTTGTLTALVDGVPGYGTNNVWNGNSRQGLSVDGVDIDHFYITWASNILKPMDVSLYIDLTTGTDRFTMSYMLFQFRSELGPGGVITNYAIRIN